MAVEVTAEAARAVEVMAATCAAARSLCNPGPPRRCCAGYWHRRRRSRHHSRRCGLGRRSRRSTTLCRSPLSERQEL
eukprot:scaffold132308_cov66-Phaeocystis_antarctica.AAC.3